MNCAARGLFGYWPAVIVFVALPAFSRERIWDIEFLGYKGIDIEAVRKALPVHEGDDYAGDETKRKVRQAVAGALGRDATDVQGASGCIQRDLLIQPRTKGRGPSLR
jgi:hypothetical protein